MEVIVQNGKPEKKVNSMNKKIFSKYTFACIELIPFILAVAAQNTLLSIKPEKAQLLYWILILGVVCMEAVYLIRVIKYKNGYIGLPITLILFFRYNILGKSLIWSVPVSSGIFILIGVIILVRICEIIFIVKDQSEPKDFFSYKGILSSLLVDMLSFFRF